MTMMAVVATITTMINKTAEDSPPQFCSGLSSTQSLYLSQLVPDQNQANIQWTGERTQVNDPTSEQCLSCNGVREVRGHYQIEQAG